MSHAKPWSFKYQFSQYLTDDIISAGSTSWSQWSRVCGDYQVRYRWVRRAERLLQQTLIRSSESSFTLRGSFLLKLFSLYYNYMYVVPLPKSDQIFYKLSAFYLSCHVLITTEIQFFYLGLVRKLCYWHIIWTDFIKRKNQIHMVQSNNMINKLFVGPDERN